MLARRNACEGSAFEASPAAHGGCIVGGPFEALETVSALHDLCNRVERWSAEHSGDRAPRRAGLTGSPGAYGDEVEHPSRDHPTQQPEFDVGSQQLVGLGVQQEEQG